MTGINSSDSSYEDAEFWCVDCEFRTNSIHERNQHEEENPGHEVADEDSEDDEDDDDD